MIGQREQHQVSKHDRSRYLRQVVLSACPYQFGLIRVKSESAGGHSLLNSSNTLLDAGYCQLHTFWLTVYVQLIIISERV